MTHQAVLVSPPDQMPDNILHRRQDRSLANDCRRWRGGVKGFCQFLAILPADPKDHEVGNAERCAPISLIKLIPELMSYSGTDAKLPRLGE